MCAFPSSSSSALDVAGPPAIRPCRLVDALPAEVEATGAAAEAILARFRHHLALSEGGLSLPAHLSARREMGNPNKLDAVIADFGLDQYGAGGWNNRLDQTRQDPWLPVECAATSKVADSCVAFPGAHKGSTERQHPAKRLRTRLAT